MDINKKMKNGIFTMNGEHTQSENQHNMLGSHANITYDILKGLLFPFFFFLF